jgi:hypothetical protein
MSLILVPIYPFLGISVVMWFLIQIIPQWIIHFSFNFASIVSLTSELFTLVTFALLICFLPLAFESSELFSKLGVYHQLSNFDSPFGETLSKKFLKVYLLNLKLSLLTFLIIFFFIITIIQFKEIFAPTDFFCSVENLAPNKLYEPVKVRENALT